MRYFFELILLNIKDQLSFGKDSILWLVVRLIEVLLGILIIIFVYDRVLDIEGFNREEAILIYSLYYISISIFYTFFSWTLWYSRSYLLNGKLSEILRYPINPFIFITGKSFSLSELFGVIYGVIIFIYSAIALNLTTFNIALLIIFLLIGSLGVIGIFLIIASAGSLFPRIEEAFSSLMTMLDFSQYPISIYGKNIRFFLTYIFPISMISFYPVAFSLKKYPFDFIFILIPGYSIFLFLFGYFLFVKSVKKYEGTGS